MSGIDPQEQINILLKVSKIAEQAMEDASNAETVEECKAILQRPLRDIRSWLKHIARA